MVNVSLSSPCANLRLDSQQRIIQYLGVRKINARNLFTEVFANMMAFNGARKLFVIELFSLRI